MFLKALLCFGTKKLMKNKNLTKSNKIIFNSESQTKKKCRQGRRKKTHTFENTQNVQNEMKKNDANSTPNILLFSDKFITLLI